MLGTMPISAMETLRMSSQYAAADIFLIVPLSSAAALFQGVRKAAIVYLLIPAICLATGLIAYLAPAGWESLRLALPGLIAIPTLSLLPGLVEEYLPLSRPPVRLEQTSRNMILMFASMLSMAAVAAVSWLAWSFDILWIMTAIELIIVAFLHWVFLRTIRRRPLVSVD
jgi:hypothetical protein